MLYREIIALCSEIHTKHTNTLCGQNVGLLNVKTCHTVHAIEFQIFKHSPYSVTFNEHHI